mgnify:CR=1 FL=1
MCSHCFVNVGSRPQKKVKCESAEGAEGREGLAEPVTTAPAAKSIILPEMTDKESRTQVSSATLLLALGAWNADVCTV